MKRIKTLFICLPFLGLLLTGCGNDPTNIKINEQGLAFYLTDDNEYYVAQGTSGLLSHVVIPETYNGLPVTGIMESGFSSHKMNSIVLSNNIKTIEPIAFYNCTFLTSITIPNSVTSIDSNAFCGCSSLTSITIPNSVTSIKDYAFCGCSSLTSINIPNSVTSIGGNVFRGCTSLTSITIPNSITSIGDYAFYCCSSLTSITIPNSVISIFDGAFYGCSSLPSIRFEGTTSEWKAAVKASYYKYAIVVICDDGEVEL